MTNLLLVIHPFIGRNAREDWLDRQNEHVNIFQVVIERGIGRWTIVAPDGDPQSPGLNDLNRVIEPDHVVWRTGLYLEISRDTTRFISRRRLTFELLREAGFFKIAHTKQ